jgi:hypothetical protein
MSSTPISTTQVVARVAASLLGGYAFVWGFTTLGIVLGLAVGLPFAEARTLLYLLVFLVFPVCFCWAFVAESLPRVWAVLAGGGGLMTTAGWLLSRALTG